jgi:G3E family GTPase
MKEIRTTLVYGFLEAGKTTYIQDCIFHDYFHKRGSTLILCFEAGETEYDAQKLAPFRTAVAYYEGGEDITAFCRASIRQYAPDRIYVEMNGMMEGLRGKLPEEIKVVYTTMLIDGGTLSLYMTNMRQLLQDMVSACDQITINRCPDRQGLAQYSRLFRLMNRKATYLWQGPGGYHEKAFDDMVPFDLEQDALEIGEGEFVPFVLDAAEHPEHYEGKTVSLGGQLRDGLVGRTVMTCCLADLQFLGVACEGEALPEGGWVRITGMGTLRRDQYGQKRLALRVFEASPMQPPEELILKGA